MGHYYADHTVELRQELGRQIPTEALRALHQKKPVVHFLVTVGLVAVLASATAAIVYFDRWYLWLPFALISGFALFNFTVLLHEVTHRTVLDKQNEKVNRWIGILYAIPSGISSSQFIKWHLDHHASLGHEEEDPKRHYLSPKINERWLKLLYFTPALFPIYFRAAARETASYPPELQRTIRLERTVTILFHLTVLGLVGFFAGWGIAWKAYLVPYFFVFPIAFALNRIGQHYDIDPDDPAKWATLVKGTWFWNIVYLNSNYHLEHHYFPDVPLYNLPRLQKLLWPFYEQRGMTPRTYPELFWKYVVLNRKPHTKWNGDPQSHAATVAEPAPHPPFP